MFGKQDRAQEELFVAGSLRDFAQIAARGGARRRGRLGYFGGVEGGEAGEEGFEEEGDGGVLVGLASGVPDGFDDAFGAERGDAPGGSVQEFGAVGVKEVGVRHAVAQEKDVAPGAGEQAEEFAEEFALLFEFDGVAFEPGEDVVGEYEGGFLGEGKDAVQEVLVKFDAA